MTHGNGKHADTTTTTAATDDSGTPPEVVDLQADIERTREDLAETVDLLSAKLDVKTRVREQVAHTVATTKEGAAHQVRAARDKATGADGRPTPAAISVAGGVVAAVAAVIAVRLWLGSKGHRRSRRRGRGR